MYVYIYIYKSDIQCMYIYIYTLHIAHSVSCFQLSVHLMHINLNLRPTNRTLLASKPQSNVVAPLFLVRPRTLTMSVLEVWLVKCRPETGTTKIRGVPSKWSKSMVKWTCVIIFENGRNWGMFSPMSRQTSTSHL